MRQIIWMVGLATLLAAAPAAAQTRVAVGFGVPRPFVHGLVVVGRPYWYPHALVVRRAYGYRPPVFVGERVYVPRHRLRHRFVYDDDDRW